MRGRGWDGDPMQEAIIFVGIGRCYMSLSNYATAEAEFKLALVDMRASGNRAGEAGVIANLGELHYWQAINSLMDEAKHHFARALEYYSQALPLMREVGDRMAKSEYWQTRDSSTTPGVNRMRP